jgi:hypothetical protein
LPIHDSGDLVEYPECKPRKQMVRQLELPSWTDANTMMAPVYTFDATWWEQLDTDNQVATLYHEVIYREFRRYRAEVSVAARRFNRFLFSLSVTGLSQKQYLAFLASNRVQEFHLQTKVGSFPIYPIHLEGGLWGAHFNAAGRIFYLSLGIDSRNWQLELNLPFHLSGVKGIEVSSTGEIKSLNGNFILEVNPKTQQIEKSNSRCGFEKGQLNRNYCLSIQQVRLSTNHYLTLKSEDGATYHVNPTGQILGAVPSPVTGSKQ